MSWSDAELTALRRAYASGTLKVSYGDRLVEYGSAADLLARIRIIERALGQAPLPVAGFAGFGRGD